MFSGWPMSISGAGQSNWTGTWYGTVEAYPKGALGAGWNVTWEIGAYPMVDNSCTVWRIIYTENGIVKMTKNNSFCRGRGADDLFVVDGATGGKLAVQWLNNVLVSSFKHLSVFAVANMRMRGDYLEEEILVTNDNPGIQNVVVSIRVLSIHTIRVKRMPNTNSGEKRFQPCLLLYIAIFLIVKLI